MLEHFGKNNNLNFFRHTSWKDVLVYWYELLKPTGELYMSVPDFESVCKEYLENGDLERLIGITIGGQKMTKIYTECYLIIKLYLKK